MSWKRWRQPLERLKKTWAVTKPSSTSTRPTKRLKSLTWGQLRKNWGSTRRSWTRLPKLPTQPDSVATISTRRSRWETETLSKNALFKRKCKRKWKTKRRKSRPESTKEPFWMVTWLVRKKKSGWRKMRFRCTISSLPRSASRSSPTPLAWTSCLKKTSSWRKTKKSMLTKQLKPTPNTTSASSKSNSKTISLPSSRRKIWRQRPS